jgi:disease resistance protein RPM1
LLANREYTKDEWDQVKISIGCALERNPSVEGMMKIISLSYFDLPPHLKTCLLYMSLFQEDAILHKKGLIWRWIAEGFICKEGRYTLYEFGEKCFNELVNRSLIQPEKTVIGVVKTCRVHDTILDFITSKSIEENFVTVVALPNTTIGTQSKVRRLSLQVSMQGNLFEQNNQVWSHVRSLRVSRHSGEITSFGRFRHSGEITCLDRFRRLRVLDFGVYTQIKIQHVEDIGRLLQLRYLNLSGTTVRELPQRIGDLRFLEMLNLRHTGVRELPASIVNLNKLVHLFVEHMVKFPDGISKMQALEKSINVHVSRESIKFLQELGQLQTLKKLRVDFKGVSATGDENGVIKEAMKAIQSLRALYITNDTDFLMEAYLPQLALQKQPSQGFPVQWALSSTSRFYSFR